MFVTALDRPCSKDERSGVQPAAIIHVQTNRKYRSDLNSCNWTGHQQSCSAPPGKHRPQELGVELFLCNDQSFIAAKDLGIPSDVNRLLLGRAYLNREHSVRLLQYPNSRQKTRGVLRNVRPAAMCFPQSMFC
jgi:hypothetical protein